LLFIIVPRCASSPPLAIVYYRLLPLLIIASLQFILSPRDHPISRGNFCSQILSDSEQLFNSNMKIISLKLGWLFEQQPPQPSKNVENWLFYG
jgi:hypothetical protein